MGRQVTAVFPEARSVELADSASLGYGKLIWATGGAPRRLACEGHDIVGLHTVRTRGDVDRIGGELPAVEHAAVVGGGYTGLEAAAVLTNVGKRGTVLEAVDRVL